jgi:hypothetical protein
MTMRWKTIITAGMFPLANVITRFGPWAMLVTLIVVLLLAACDWFLHIPVSVAQVSAVVGLVMGVILIRLRPADQIVGLLNVAAAVAALVQAIFSLEVPWCQCAVEIVAIDQTRIATTPPDLPIQVRCDVDIEGTLTRTRPEYYTYVVLEDHPRDFRESPKFWPYAVGDRGRAHENKVSPDWRGTELNFCTARSQRSTYTIRAIVSPHPCLGQPPLPNAPSHACRSRPLRIQFVEAGRGPLETPAELRRPLLEGMEPWLVFFLGRSGNESLETIDSYSVVATVHYAGFDDPLAKIDWGDGRGYRTAETQQGNPWFLTNKYSTPGKKEARFLIEARDGRRMERPARIEILPRHP